MTHATIDFETYSEAGLEFDGVKWRALAGQTKRGLPAVGTYNYVWHPSFRPLSLCFDLHAGAGVERVTFPDFSTVYPCPVRLSAWVTSGRPVEGHNVGFEDTVWQWCVANWGWPAWPLEQQRCSAAKCRAAAYPGGLDEAGEVLQIEEKKDPKGKALIRKLTMPRNPTKKDPALRWTPETAPDDFEAFYAYNEQDVRAESEVSACLPDLTPHEFGVWQLDQRINRRGMAIDLPGVENCIVILEQATERAGAELSAITGGTVQKSTEVAATLRWMATRGVHLYSLDEETVSYALGRPYPPDVLRVLRIRQALAFGSVKKLYAMRAQTGADGRLRDQYVYYGAHTGLWNGRGVQPANLYKPHDPEFEKPEGIERALAAIATRSIEFVEYAFPHLDPLEVVASCLRSLIIAEPGSRLISADFSAIQAVVCAALAGEDWVLEVFRTDGRLYEAMAARLTGKTMQEYVDYKTKRGAHHPDRQLGKLASLSGFFGAWIEGWKRFGADKLLGDDESIKQAILKTRAATRAIVELWGGQTRDRFKWNERQELFGLEGAVVSALLDPGKAFDYRGIVYQMHERTLYCRPPSGGYIRYHNAGLSPSTRPYARPWEYEIYYDGHNSNATKGAPGWQTMSLYGGVLTQNVVSHEAREIQALALLRLEDAGYPVVMHTHDENAVEAPAGFGSADEHTRLTGILPDWARTPDGQPWPIKVPDSWECARYGKW